MSLSLLDAAENERMKEEVQDVTKLIGIEEHFVIAGIVQKNIQVHRMWKDDMKVKGAPAKLRQNFSNFLVNNLDELASGGHILIRVKAFGSAEGEKVRVTFADTGSGIPAAVNTKIFDPFFSAKGGHGTGPGHWVTKQQVEKDGCSIRLRSRSEVPGTRRSSP